MIIMSAAYGVIYLGGSVLFPQKVTVASQVQCRNVFIKVM